jgi:type III pantothenate kinase
MEMPQFLVLDFGNTLCKVAIFENENIIYKDVVPDFNVEYLKSIFLKFPYIKSSIISSVVNNKPEISEYLHSKCFTIVLSANTPIPILNKYLTPETLGKDRLSAAVGAFTLFRNKNVLSIDAGTAIKYDFINQEGEYLGGGISPGLSLRFKALHTFTDKLPLVDWKDFGELIGRNTEESILSGVIQGVASEIDGIIDRYKSLFPDLTIILTGGESIYFEKYIKNSIFAVPNLVLTGLYEILKFNETKN